MCVCLSTSTRGRKLCSVSSVAQLIHVKISHKVIFSMSLMCMLQLHGISSACRLWVEPECDIHEWWSGCLKKTTIMQKCFLWCFVLAFKCLYVFPDGRGIYGACFSGKIKTK